MTYVYLVLKYQGDGPASIHGCFAEYKSAKKVAEKIMKDFKADWYGESPLKFKRKKHDDGSTSWSGHDDRGYIYYGPSVVVNKLEVK